MSETATLDRMKRRGTKPVRLLRPSGRQLQPGMDPGEQAQVNKGFKGLNRVRVGRMRLWVTVGLLLAFLVGCAGRGRAPDAPAAPDTLENQTALATLAVWQQRLEQYVERQGNGDPAVLSHTRDLRSRHRQRPATIGFSALSSNTPGTDGKDVNGVLLGVEPIDGEIWYLFLVATIQRADYRPVGIQDIRLAAFSAGEKGLLWRVGNGSQAALDAYRKLPADTLSVHFPGNRDRFELSVTDSLITAREQRSGARWELGMGSAPKTEQ